MRLTTELRVDGFEGRAGGADEEVDVALVETGFWEELDEVAGVAERAVAEINQIVPR